MIRQGTAARWSQQLWEAENSILAVRNDTFVAALVPGITSVGGAKTPVK